VKTQIEKMQSRRSNDECERARVGLSLAIDGEADICEVVDTAAHLAVCEECQGYAERIALITRALRASRFEGQFERETPTA
jgi:predicted anti-sigma-YlaC factor YlaD